MMYSSLIYCVLFSLLVVGIHGATQQQCNHDYECGNPPYTLCSVEGECHNAVPGLAYDAASDRFFYAIQSCNLNDVNATMRAVSPSGGVSSIVITFPVINNLTFDRIHVNKVHGVEENHLYFKYTDPGAFGPEVSYTYDLATNQLDEIGYAVFVGIQPQQILSFSVDHDTSKTYACAYINNLRSDDIYSILNFDRIIDHNTSANSGNYSYYNVPCDLITQQDGSDAIYWSKANSTGQTSVYQGSKSCELCDAPSALFSLPFSFVDFLVADNTFYYASNQGIYSSDITGQNVTLLVPKAAYGLKIVNGLLYWNDDNGIQSANLDGSNVQQITQDDKFCRCASTFHGSFCSECDGQQQWVQGQPSCVPYLDNGFPETCQANYQCGGSPFTQCFFNQCSCILPLTGAPLCQTCTNSSQSIVWVNGAPTCA